MKEYHGTVSPHLFRKETASSKLHINSIHPWNMTMDLKHRKVSIYMLVGHMLLADLLAGK